MSRAAGAARPLTVALGIEGVTSELARLVADAEALGAGSMWTPEAWGHHALTPLAFLAARTSRIRLVSGIAQLGARTPAMLAMSALSLQALSGGRFLLGLGVSGAGDGGLARVRFTAPLRATRETVQIVRVIAAGQRLDHQGDAYQIPLPGGPGGRCARWPRRRRSRSTWRLSGRRIRS